MKIKQSVDAFDRVLAGVRLRLRVNAFLGGATVLLGVVASAVATVAVLRARAGYPPVTLELVTVGGIVFGIVAVALTFAGRGTLEWAARETDRRAGTADRFVAGLHWRALDAPTAFEVLAMREVAGFAAGIDPGRVAPVRWPTGARWLVVPALAMIAAAVFFSRGFEQSAPERAAAAALLKEAAGEVAAADDPALEPMAETIRGEEQRLQQTDAAKPGEAAVRSLARTVAALRELARARAAADAAVQAAGSGQAGHSDTTADANRDALLAQAAGRAAERTATQTALSRQELQRLITKLEELKQAAGGQKGGADGTTDRAGEEALAAAAAAAGKQSAPGGGTDDSDRPGGPGSERDTGTAPLRDRSGEEVATQGPEETAALPEADGASAVAAVISTDGSSASNLEYRQAFEAAAPAAEESVLREELPPGSRSLVRRYFESIRPPD